MQQLETFFNSPRGHILVAGVFVLAAQLLPAWSGILNQIALAFGYGAVVAGAPAPKAAA
jgi:hypothetical protein